MPVSVSIRCLVSSLTLLTALACGGGTASKSDSDNGGAAGNSNSSAGAAGSNRSSKGSSAAGTSGGNSAGNSAGGASFSSESGSVNTYPIPNGGASSGSSSSLAAGGAAISLCGGSCICSNGIDDDQDGLTDGFDPECTGPLDNDEGTFATGIPGDNRDPNWQDCFFDGNSGAGDDHCRYNTKCLTGELPADDGDCTVTQDCIDFCKPLTSNGCDCFGCCTVQLDDGTTKDIQTTASCSIAKVNDPTACTPCLKSAACGNTCGECELCPGKTVEDLPESCTSSQPPGTGGEPPGPAYTCDSGEAVCSADLPCATGYCSQGCCISLMIQ